MTTIGDLVGGAIDEGKILLGHPQVEIFAERGLLLFHGGQDSMSPKILSTNRLTGVKQGVTVMT